VRCSQCGAVVSGPAKFCLECGARLPSGPPPVEVRKTVTVVFCDLTGSTALGERHDPETLRTVMTRYFSAMSAVLERHGGSVEKFIGDAVMAVFGVPVVHEDDALRAVRAAWEMQTALAELSGELAGHYGVSVAARGWVTGDGGDRGCGERGRAVGAGGGAG
jgi:class 3 adenylate cyclase